MSGYIISCCSTVDLAKDYLDSRKISTISMHLMLAGKDFRDDFGKSISYSEFYQAMRDGADTKTSQINVEEFHEYFVKMLSEGHDVLHVSLSSGLSGCFNSAMIAAEEARKEFPERKLLVVDSLGASSGYGLIIDKLADLRDEGYSIDELFGWLQKHKTELHHWFFSTDLTYYVKGGRISKASGWFGTLLKICPLLNMDAKGTLVPRQKVCGKRSVIKALVQKMSDNAQDGEGYKGKCFISNSDCMADALEVKRQIEEKFPNLNCEIRIESIGTTIGSHTGPGTVALFFWGNKRED